MSEFDGQRQRNRPERRQPGEDNAPGGDNAELDRLLQEGEALMANMARDSEQFLLNMRQQNGQ